jgi:hypothetical protein
MGQSELTRDVVVVVDRIPGRLGMGSRAVQREASSRLMIGDAPTASAEDRWRLVSILGWIRSYDRGGLRGDLIAGVAVAALIVPNDLGYAGIAGIPLQNGLYVAAAYAILYAILGTSRQISTGPSSGLRPWPRAPSRSPGSRGSRM